MSAATLPDAQPRNLAVAANQMIYWLGRHWLMVATALWALYVGLPWLAPVLMKLGFYP